MYGFSISKFFDLVFYNNERDRVYKYYDNLEDVFFVIVWVGDLVFLNEVRDYKCWLVEYGLEFLLVEFYVILDCNLKYVKEFELFFLECCCYYIGDIKIEYGWCDNLENNEINV